MHPTAGCLSCKSRKKKCDLTEPRCQACQRNLLICVWPRKEQKQRCRGGVPSSSMSMFSVKPETVARKSEQQPRNKSRHNGPVRAAVHPSPPTVPASLSPTITMTKHSKYLLHHYLHRTGKMASAHIGGYAPFTDSLLPIAHNSDMLLESILTFSSFHLTATGSQFSPVLTMEHQALALRKLKFGLTRYDCGDKDVGIQLFLSMLMLCCVELANNIQDESSFRHLTALRHLAPGVLSRWDAIPEAYKPAMVFGRELYAYFLAVSCICAPEDVRNSSVIRDSATIFSDIAEHGHTGAMLGCSDELFCLVPEVVAILEEARKLTLPGSRIAVPDLTAARLSSDAAMLMPRIGLLLTPVSLWEPCESNDGSFQTSGRILRLAVKTLLAEALYWCTAVQKEFEADRECSPESLQFECAPNLELQTTPLVAEAVTLLTKLPAQSRIATTMCWSMAVLGSYATVESHRTTLRQYLLNMESTFGFRNMTRTRLLLEYIWSRISTFQTARPMDISQAMAAIGGRFLLG